MEKVTKTHLAHSIEKTVNESEYDDSVKTLLSDKYDYLSISFIRLPKGNMEESKNKLINMLSTLFSQKLDAEEKKKILEQEHQMKMTRRLERGIHSMCNVGEGLVEQGIEQGIERGIERGIEQSIQVLIKTIRRYGASDEEIINQLMEGFQLDKTKAEAYLKKEGNEL